MKIDKLIKAAEKAQKDGYVNIAVVEKQENGKPLYHLVNIDTLLRFKTWIPVQKEIKDGVLMIKVYHHLPEKTILRSEMLRKYK